MTLQFTRQCYLFDKSCIGIGYSSILWVIINIKPKVPVTCEICGKKNVQIKYHVSLPVLLTLHATDL